MILVINGAKVQKKLKPRRLFTPFFSKKAGLAGNTLPILNIDAA